jgi:uncharacterized Tic20 family protein
VLCGLTLMSYGGQRKTVNVECTVYWNRADDDGKRQLETSVSVELHSMIIILIISISIIIIIITIKQLVTGICWYIYIYVGWFCYNRITIMQFLLFLPLFLDHDKTRHDDGL